MPRELIPEHKRRPLSSPNVEVSSCSKVAESAAPVERGCEVSVVQFVLIPEVGELGNRVEAVELGIGFRRAASCTRVRPPRRDKVYWHCLRLETHLPHFGRLASHLTC